MTTKRRADRLARIENHGRKLLDIFPQATETDPLDLAKKLHRLESTAHRIAEQYCNGDIDADSFDAKSEAILVKVDKLINFRAVSVPVFINGDPRGCALKIDDEWMRANDCRLASDWGGYGLLAPEID